jgi:hypothetical protein
MVRVDVQIYSCGVHVHVHVLILISIQQAAQATIPAWGCAEVARAFY